MTKAISLWQPWASAIALGLKHYETRSWYTSYRGNLIICSAKKKTSALGVLYFQLHQKQEAFYILERKKAPIVPRWSQLPFGAMIAKVDLVDCLLMTNELIESMTKLEKLWGDWKPGRYAWKFENIQPLDPRPIKGRQGFFNVEI